MLSRKTLYSLIFFILLISFFLRFYDLERDPLPYNEYGIGYVDEGGYVHSARNKALFDAWTLEEDSWNSLYLSPTFTALQYLSFTFLGVSTFSMRLTSALLGLASLLIASFLIMKKQRKLGLIYLILLSMNTMLIVYSRIATLQIMVVSLILVIIGLIVYDTKKSWLVVGLLLPTTFLSKFTSLFFVIAVPFSLLLYSYWDKTYRKRLGFLLIGGIVSLSLWLLWLLPNFEAWLFTAKMLSHELKYSLFRVAAVFSHALRFAYLHQIAVLFTVGWSLITFQQWKNEKKIEYIDVFLLTALTMFTLYLFVVDFFIRRWVLIVPLVLLMGARFLCQVGDLQFKERKWPWQAILTVLLGLYLITNLSPLVDYFGQSENSHMIINNSQKLAEIVPSGEEVFGNAAIALGYENQMKPYYVYAKSVHVDTEEAILPYPYDCLYYRQR